MSAAKAKEKRKKTSLASLLSVDRRVSHFPSQQPAETSTNGNERVKKGTRCVEGRTIDFDFSFFEFLYSKKPAKKVDPESEVDQMLSPILESSQKQKVMILKRDPARSGAQKSPEAERVPEKSLAQREKEYNAARERIFNDAAAAKPASPTTMTTTGKKSKSNHANGKKRNNNK